MTRRRRQKIPAEPVEAFIDNLSHEGRGVARVDGKTVFVEGALAGESVRFKYTRTKRRHAEAQVETVLNASADRVETDCAHYAICGGCRLQHLHTDQQIAHKQAVMLEQLTHIGQVTPETVVPPLRSHAWGYRRKARLGVKYVTKKGRVLVGFREKHHPYIADLTSCLVLHERVGLLITPLIQLVESLSIRQALPQIEVAMGDETVVLIFRILAELTEQDRDHLQAFAHTHDIHIYLQPGGLESVTPLSGKPAALFYTLPEDNIRIDFGATDFTQVNLELNRKMVHQALDWLALTETDRVLDLFCGVGNFTLPIARHAQTVCGVEGDQALVDKAKANALANAVDATFYAADLTQAFEGQAWAQQDYNKILLDPPRSGALDIIQQLPTLDVKHIVYVSCNPATLARDAQELVHEQGYRLVKVGAMDMFPHTAHVESMALFQRP